MFPYRDYNPTDIRPWATVALIAGHAVVLATTIGLAPVAESLRLELLQQFGAFVPADPSRVSYLMATWLHAGWLHFFGNAYFLWIAGDNVEDAFGRPAYLALYVLGGVAACSAFLRAAPESTTPLVASSGAVAAVVGAYVALYPNSRIATLMAQPKYGGRSAAGGLETKWIEMPAVVWIVVWVLFQAVVSGLYLATGGWYAFAGPLAGFSLGLFVALVASKLDYVEGGAPERGVI